MPAGSHSASAARDRANLLNTWLERQDAVTAMMRDALTQWERDQVGNRDLENSVRVVFGFKSQRTREVMTRFSKIIRPEKRNRYHFGAVLMPYIARWYKKDFGIVKQSVEENPPPEGTSMEEQFNHALTVTKHLDLKDWLRASLTASAVCDATWNHETKPSLISEEASEPLEQSTLSSNARQILEHIATLPPDDDFWNDVESLAEEIRRIAQAKLQSRAEASTSAARRDAAAALTKVLQQLVTAHGETLRWLGLPSIEAPNEVDVDEGKAMITEVGHLEKVIERCAEARRTVAATEAEERSIGDQRRKAADEARQCHRAIAARLATSFLEAANRSEPNADAIRSENPNEAKASTSSETPNYLHSETARASAAHPGEFADLSSFQSITSAAAEPTPLPIPETTAKLAPPAVLADISPTPPTAATESHIPRPESRESVKPSSGDEQSGETQLTRTPEDVHPSLLRMGSDGSDDADVYATTKHSFWTAVEAGDEGGAYWVARELENCNIDQPVASQILAVLQASRWMDDEGTRFGGDIVERVKNTKLSDDRVTSILAVSAALVPALVAPETSLRGWLQQEVPEPLAPLVRAVANFANHGQRLSRALLDGIDDAGDRSQRLKDAERRIERWLADAPQRTTKFQRATRLWREMFRHELQPILLEIAAGNSAAIEAADALVSRYGSQRLIDERIDEFSSRTGKGTGNLIEGGARDQLRELVRTTIQEVQDWSRRVNEGQQLRKFDWIQGRVEELRAEVESGIAQAYAWAAEQRQSRSIEHSACGSAIQRSLDDIRRILRIEVIFPLGRAIPDADTLALDAPDLASALDERLLWCPESSACDDNAKRLEAISRSVANLPSTAEAYRAWVKLERFDAAEKLERCLPDAVIREATAPLASAQHKLEDERESLSIGVEQGVLDGYVGDERARLLETLDAVRPREAKNLAAARMRLASVRQELSRLRQTRLDEALRRWHHIEERLREGGISADKLGQFQGMVEAIHARGDVRVLDERLVLFEQSPQPDELLQLDQPAIDSFGQFRRFTENESALVSQGWGHLRASFERPNGQPFETRTIPAGKKRSAIATAMESWFALKSNGAKSDPNQLIGRVRTILNYLGFVPLTEPGFVDIESVRPTVVQLVARFSAGNLSPVPQFGSQTRGEQRVVCVWERPGVDSLSATFNELPTGGRSLLVLYLGRLTAAQRTRFRQVSRERVQFACLDEFLMMFLAGESDARLKAFFACALPYTTLNPYTPYQAGEVPPEMYFGRLELVRELQEPSGSCIVYGGRQLGKSALLREVARRFHKPEKQLFASVVDILSVGKSPQGTEAASLWTFIRQGLQEAGVGGVKKSRPRDVVEVIRVWMSENPEARLLLLLDEADNFLDADARDNFRVVHELRRLMADTGRRFKVVFAGLHNVQRFQQLPNQPLAHFGRAIQVGPLEPVAAADLVRKPLMSLGFTFESDDDVLRVLSYTNYHPGLIQLFCHDLLSQLQRSTNAPPPVRVVRQHVDTVYQQGKMRQGIRERFDYTLALDPRYQAIAWALITEQIISEKNRNPREAFDVRGLREIARFWWQNGFANTNDDEFRGLLDEMCGLGVLLGDVERGFRLRSPNVVQLLGDVEERLLELSRSPAPSMFDADQLHRLADSDRFSPLTLGQERQLLAQRWGVALVFGSDATGLDALEPTIVALDDGGPTTVKVAPATESPDTWADWLRALPRMSSGMRIVVANAPSDAAKAVRWVEVANRFASQRARSENTFCRIIIIFDAPATACWFSVPNRDDIENGLDAVLWLRKWSTLGLQARMEQNGLLALAPDISKILHATGGWGMLVDRVFPATGVERRRQDALETRIANIREGFDKRDSEEADSFLAALGIDRESRNWRLLTLLQGLLGDQPQSVDSISPDLFDSDLPGITATELSESLTYLIRVGALNKRSISREDGQGGQDLVAVDPLVNRILVR